MDKRFKVGVLAQTPNPQTLTYLALHQDYSSGFIFDNFNNLPSETSCGGIAIKRLLANKRGHYGCYSPDTEVLTPNGWVRFDELLEGVPVLSVDINTKESHFEVPSAYQKHYIEDRIFSMRGRYIDLDVTLDHRMVVTHRKTGGGYRDFYVENAENIFGKPKRYIVSTSLKGSERYIPDNVPKGYNLENLFKLAGFFVGDGCLNKANTSITRFHMKKERKIHYLKSLGFEVEEMRGNHYVVKDYKIAQWLQNNFSKDGSKYLPWNLLNLPDNLAYALINGLFNSDGCRKENNPCFYSSDSQLIEFIQSLLHLNNFHGNFTVNNLSTSERHREGLKISFSDRQETNRDISQIGRSITCSDEIADYKGYVYCCTVSTGALLVRKNKKIVVCGNCLEHPQITFNCGFFPHSVMQQARTHRVGVSFDVQSFRYTSNQFIKVVGGELDVEDVVYLRPIGSYTDRKGKKYDYTIEWRQEDLAWVSSSVEKYVEDFNRGMSEEHCRGVMPFDYRQHFVVSFNLRSLMHFLDMRAKRDAQLEIQWLCDLMLPHFEAWAPEIYHWYAENRLGKALLAP